MRETFEDQEKEFVPKQVRIYLLAEKTDVSSEEIIKQIEKKMSVKLEKKT